MKFKAKYYHLFWFFMLGNVLGVIIEGIYCCFAYGEWRTHTTFLWGWFNIVYGLGAIVVYIVSVLVQKYNAFIKFLAFTVSATLLELILGLFAQYVLNTKAWTYEFMTIGEHISVPFSLAWGILGTLFAQYVLPLLDKLFAKMQGKAFVVISNICIVFMVINLFASLAVQYRWGQRPYKPVPTNAVERFIDEHYPDEYLEQWFNNWKRRA